MMDMVLHSNKLIDDEIIPIPLEIQHVFWQIISHLESKTLAFALLAPIPGQIF